MVSDYYGYITGEGGVSFKKSSCSNMFAVMSMPEYIIEEVESSV